MNLARNRKMLSVLLLGISSGTPLALAGSTLQAWMASEHVDLKLIGIFSLVQLPYSLKFLWAPFMDRYMPPFMGRRRGWIAVAQAWISVALVGMAFSHPAQSPGLMALLALLTAFGSASQDLVIDAYRTEVLQPIEFGTGSAIHILGYRIAMIFSGSVALILSDHLPWKIVYLIMAAAMGVGIVVSFFSPEPTVEGKLPKSLKEAVVEPFKEFLQRKGSVELLAFITVYKLDVVFAVALMTPFMMELGFTKTDIGAVNKGFGLVATILGTFAGGVWLSKLGIKKSLWTFGILQGISGLCFYFLALMGHNYPMMVTTIAAENFFSGMGNAAYSAFMMSLCNPKFTATQFALLTSLMALTRTLAGAPSGWMVTQVGWPTYFLFSIFLAAPGLLLLTRFNRWNLGSSSKLS